MKGTELQSTSVTDISTPCHNCNATGEITERRPKTVQELTDVQIRFLQEADLQELKISNPFIGSEDDADSQQTQSSSSDVNIPDGNITGYSKSGGTQPQSSSGYTPSGPLPPDADL